MKCPTCESDNSEGVPVCRRCGAPLETTCSNCGFRSPPQFKFCGGCGSSLAVAAVPLGTAQSPAHPRTSEAEAGRSAPEAERRQLTVMFCDLVGSTDFSQRLDPEDLRDVIRTYHECCARVVARFGGFIARYMGDGVLVYFGFPQAHEDDAERAVRAGLGTVEAVGELRPCGDLTLQIRVGIATGLVVVGDSIGDGVSEEKAVVGATPNLAARMQSLAEPNTVVIAPSTYRLVSGLFVCDDLGLQKLKGISEPVRAWRIVRISGAESRFDATRGIRLTEFVDRDEEIHLLLGRWQAAKEGKGQVVLICGEPGIGKSRLTDRVHERVANKPYMRLLCQCSPYFANTALYPIIKQLERIADFGPSDTDEDKLNKLETILNRSEARGEHDLALLADLLGIRAEGRFPDINLSPQRKKDRTLAVLIELLGSFAVRRPLLLVFEDAQWIDPTSQELLDQLVDWTRQAPVLMIVTVRPGFSYPWASRSHVTLLTIDRLGQREARKILDAVVGGKALPPKVSQEILLKTDGVPLFVEELTKGLLTSNVLKPVAKRYVLRGSLSSLAIPSTLHDSLMARLDQLGQAKEIAQLGAVIGREFTFSLLSRVSTMSEESLIDLLGRLTDSELIFRRDLPSETTYVFKHALIQDAAYQSLLRRRREQLHLRIARELERQGHNHPEVSPELLAHHYSAGRAPREAIANWKRAAERAFSRSAHLEATNHVRHALRMLDDIDDVAERRQLELELVMQLGTALRATHGYAATDVEKVYLRARALSKQVGETPERFNVEWGLMQFFLVRGNLETAREVAKTLFEHAQRHQDRPLLMDAHLANGMVEFHLGNFVEARKHLELGSALYRPGEDQPRLFTHGQVPRVFCRSYLAWTLWILGYPDQARERVEETVALARDTSHTFSFVSALTFAVRVFQCRRDVAAVKRLAEELIAISEQRGYAYYEAIGTIHQGWALATEDRAKRGITQMCDGLEALERTGTVLSLRGFLVQLADGYRRLGMESEALKALDRAEDKGKGWGTHCWDAEIQRSRGEILAGGARTENKEAEAAFRLGLDIARRQRARSLELRTAVSYARMLRRQGRYEEAHSLLGPCLESFDEGWDTTDLRDARALMEASGASV